MHVRFFTGRILIAAAILAVAGCQWQGAAGEKLLVDAAGDRVAGDRAAAEALCVRGDRQWQKGKLAQAADLFRQATLADPTYGTAHNRLGSVQFDQGDLYAAAWSFQHAAELLPDRGEPLNNLGLVLQAAGRWDEAAQHFAEACSLAPGRTDFLANFVLVRRLRGDGDLSIEQQLHELALRETRPDWRAWIEDQLALELPADRRRIEAAADASEERGIEEIATPRADRADRPKPDTAIPDAAKPNPPNRHSVAPMPEFLPPPLPDLPSAAIPSARPATAHFGSLSDG